ncbi:MAG: hypothetical protein ACJAZQ_002417 [Cognaticolwellia sp.]|jgi:hypothetical protein
MLRLHFIAFIIKLFMRIRPLTFVTDFIHTLNCLSAMIKPNATLTRAQKVGLSFLLMGMVMTETLNWAAFERRSLKKAKSSRLRWIFYRSKIAWQLLLTASIKQIIKHYGIEHGTIAFDDSDKQRTK